MKPKPDQSKAITIRMSADLWKRLALAKIEGKISTIQQALLDGAELVLKKGVKK